MSSFYKIRLILVPYAHIKSIVKISNLCYYLEKGNRELWKTTKMN